MKNMKIYLLSQDDNRGYDTYSSCVVCAESEEEAKRIHPDGRDDPFIKGDMWGTWANSPESVHCEEIGVANDLNAKGVIYASFNAG